jgi:hypothetical protein
MLEQCAIDLLRRELGQPVAHGPHTVLAAPGRFGRGR